MKRLFKEYESATLTYYDHIQKIYRKKTIFKREGKHVYKLYIITELIKKFYKFEIMTQYVLNLRHEAY